jgi:hypothetical protein
MKYSSLDTIVKGYLLQKRYPMHFYIDFLIYAARCFEELHMDTIGNIRTVRLPVNDYFAVRLPDDYIDWTKVGIESGQFIKPLIQREGMNRRNNYTTQGIIATLGTPTGTGTDGTYAVSLTGGFGTGATASITKSGTTITSTLTAGGQDYAVGDTLTATITGGSISVPVATITDSGKIPFGSEFNSDMIQNYFYTTFAGYYLNYNDHLEYTGRSYGLRVDRSDSFKVLPERNEIQLHNSIDADYIVLEYLSDGSEIDNVTQITPYAKSTIEAFINWKIKENGRSYGEGERQRAEILFTKEHKRLRARMSDLTLNDIKASIYKNSSGAPK